MSKRKSEDPGLGGIKYFKKEQSENSKEKSWMSKCKNEDPGPGGIKFFKKEKISLAVIQMRRFLHHHMQTSTPVMLSKNRWREWVSSKSLVLESQNRENLSF